MQLIAIDSVQISTSVTTDRILYDCVATDYAPRKVYWRLLKITGVMDAVLTYNDGNINKVNVLDTKYVAKTQKNNCGIEKNL